MSSTRSSGTWPSSSTTWRCPRGRTSRCGTPRLRITGRTWASTTAGASSLPGSTAEAGSGLGSGCMDIAIVGGGIGGLTLALLLQERGLSCRVYESAPEVKALGVGITLLPHAMRELTALGLGEALARQGIENLESCFFNRFGQLIYSEPRGRAAGYPVPEVGIHRGRVHLTLWQAAIERLGGECLLADHQCVGIEQREREVTVRLRSTATGAVRPSVTADVAIACDGVNSTVRRQFYPGEDLCF